MYQSEGDRQASKISLGRMVVSQHVLGHSRYPLELAAEKHKALC